MSSIFWLVTNYRILEDYNITQNKNNYIKIFTKKYVNMAEED